MNTKYYVTTIILITAFLVVSGCTSSVAQVEERKVIGVDSPAAPTPRPYVVSIPTPTPLPDPTETVTYSPPGTSSTNPIHVGYSTSFTDHYNGKTFTVEMCLLRTLRGDRAYRYLCKWSSMNKAPPEGKEYLMANISLSVSGNPGDVLTFNRNRFTMVCNGVEQDDVIMACPYPLGQSAMVNVPTNGWICFLVDPSCQNPLIKYESADGNTEVWFVANSIF